MDSNQTLRSQITEVVAEELGILADVIFDEVLEELVINEFDLSSYHAGKFIRILGAKLPKDMDNRQQVIRDIGQLLIQAR